MHDESDTSEQVDPIDQPESHLDGLGARFLAGVELYRRGDIDHAADAFRDVLAAEPRLAEPRLELARIYLDSGRLDEAEAQAREGLRILEAGGLWLEALEENVVLGLAHGLLAEVLRQIADTDEVIFGEPERFHEITHEARAHFAKAAATDPENQHAHYHAFFLNLELPDSEPGDSDADTSSEPGAGTS